MARHICSYKIIMVRSLALVLMIKDLDRVCEWVYKFYEMKSKKKKKKEKIIKFKWLKNNILFSINYGPTTTDCSFGGQPRMLLGSHGVNPGYATVYMCMALPLMLWVFSFYLRGLFQIPAP